MWSTLKMSHCPHIPKMVFDHIYNIHISHSEYVRHSALLVSGPSESLDKWPSQSSHMSTCRDRWYTNWLVAQHKKERSAAIEYGNSVGGLYFLLQSTRYMLFKRLYMLEMEGLVSTCNTITTTNTRSNSLNSLAFLTFQPRTQHFNLKANKT